MEYLGLETLNVSHNYIYVSNHQSFFDTALIGRVVPSNSYAIAKNSLKYIPFFGFLFALSGNFYIKRNDSEKAKKTLQNIIQKIKFNKSSIFIFPQGTRSKDNKIIKLKRGFIHLAKETQTDILPIIISTYKLDDIVFNFRNKRTIYVKICDKIDYCKSDDDILLELKNEMIKSIQELDCLGR